MEKFPIKETVADNEDYRAVLLTELGLVPGESETVAADKIEAALKSPSFLEKIRDNNVLRRALKIMIVAFALFKAEPMTAQTVADQTKQEQLDQNKEWRENRALLVAGEYSVPAKVIIAFGEVVDPGLMGVPAGGFFSKDYLNTPEKREYFASILWEQGYSQDDVKRFAEYFTNGNIVFNDDALRESGFRDILAHERLHKDIFELPADRRAVLDQARDAILNDYYNKEAQWSDFGDKLHLEWKQGKISDEQYIALINAEIQKLDPILLDKNGHTSGLIPITRNADEFYTYLMMGELSSKVESCLRDDYPDAFRIYQELKEKIYLAIYSASNLSKTPSIEKK